MSLYQMGNYRGISKQLKSFIFLKEHNFSIQIVSMDKNYDSMRERFFIRLFYIIFIEIFFEKIITKKQLKRIEDN